MNLWSTLTLIPFGILLIWLQNNDAAGAQYRCSCMHNFFVSCKSNATDKDLCYECRATECGLTVTDVYFHVGSVCLVDNLTVCCPHVTRIIIDDLSLCDCYCKIVNAKISFFDGSPHRNVKCNCSQSRNATTTTTSAPHTDSTPRKISTTSSSSDTNPKWLDSKSALFGSGITFGALLLISGLVVSTVLLRRRYSDASVQFCPTISFRLRPFHLMEEDDEQ